MKVTAALSSLPPLMELLGGFGMAARSWYGSRQIAQRQPDDRRSSRRSSPTLFLMYGPAKKLSRVNANLQQAIAASERIFEMLDTHTEVVEKPGAAPLRAVPQRRSSSATSRFGYDDGPAGSCAACRSRCAPGRWSRSSAAAAPARRRSSTCCRASTTSAPAAILIDGVDIRDVTLASLRSQIGIVTQETVLFDDIDREQHRLRRRRRRRRQEIEAAARAAQRARLHRRRCRTATTR